MLLVCCSNVESSPPFARSYMKKNPVALIRSYGKKIYFLLIAWKNQFWLSRTLSRPDKTFRPNNNNTAAFLGHLTSVLIVSMRTKTGIPRFLGKEIPLSQQSRTQSLQAFWSAGQRREDSGDIEKIQFF